MTKEFKRTISLPEYDVDITFRPKAKVEPELGTGPLLVERYPDFVSRPRLVDDKLDFLPGIGPFTFPAPYNTECIRLTNYQHGEIPGGVEPIGGNYWLRASHTGEKQLDILLCESADKGGIGPYILTVNLYNGEVITKRALLSQSGHSRLLHNLAEFWYFSAGTPGAIYFNDGPRMIRYYGTEHREAEEIFNAESLLGKGNLFIDHMHSSDDDLVHCCTVKRTTDWQPLGCLVFFEETGAHLWYPVRGEYDESIVSRDGRYLIIFENLDGRNGEDNRIIDLQTRDEFILPDELGAGGHHDVGDETMIAMDNWFGAEPAWRKWSLPRLLDKEKIEDCAEEWYTAPHWFSAPQYISYRKGLCVGGSVNKSNPPHGNEFIAFGREKLGQITVLAPTMSTISGDSYNDMPRGVLDVSGQYFVFTANLGGPHRDAFLLKIPQGV